jgi:hypothetical protein
MLALGKFGTASRRRAAPPLALGTFGMTNKSYGLVPASFQPRAGYGTTPALGGLFRAGTLTVGISQVNAMATHVNRGSGG